MKLDELRTKVYEVAQVSTTRQLKAKYEQIKALDMRRKASWEKALDVVQPPPDEFENWLANPPNEYEELFAEIETASEEYRQKLIETKKLGQEVAAMADDLDVLAAECQAEADVLKQEVQATRRVKRRAELN
jgi:predicted TIM-barrel fold metal-dependent hydrolase